MTENTIAGRLRAMRIASGVSSYRIGQLGGLTRGHVGIIETGHAENPRVDTIRRICVVLGCTTDYLAFGDGCAPSKTAIRAAVKAAEWCPAPGTVGP
jgi:transcriptional regulator with XRE-family HTH domain